MRPLLVKYLTLIFFVFLKENPERRNFPNFQHSISATNTHTQGPHNTYIQLLSAIYWLRQQPLQIRPQIDPFLHTHNNLRRQDESYPSYSNRNLNIQRPPSNTTLFSSSYINASIKLSTESSQPLSIKTSTKRGVTLLLHDHAKISWHTCTSNQTPLHPLFHPPRRLNILQ